MAAARLMASLLPHEHKTDEEKLPTTTPSRVHPLLRRELTLLSSTMHVAGRESRVGASIAVGLPQSVHDAAAVAATTLPRYRPGFLLPLSNTSSTH
jgi:hypothetical protein